MPSYIISRLRYKGKKTEKWVLSANFAKRGEAEWSKCTQNSYFSIFARVAYAILLYEAIKILKAGLK